MQKRNTPTVLVLGVGGNVSMGILRAIEMSGLSCRVSGACISDDSPGLYFCSSAYLSPYANSNDFIPWLIDICNKECVDIVLSGVEENLLSIADNISLLRKKTSAAFITGDPEQLKIGHDKLVTCKWLQQNDCNYPHWANGDDIKGAIDLGKEYGWPIIAKPRCGKSSQGIHLLENENALPSPDADYVFQEYIGTPDEEYTVGVYGDKKGQIHGPIIMRRTLKDGMTFRAEVVDDKTIFDECIKVCTAFQPVGPLNIQLRKDKMGRAVTFELNVRYSGSTPMRANFGYNDVKAAIVEYIYNKPINECFSVRQGIAYRYWNEVYTTKEHVNSLRQNGSFKIN